MKKILFLLALLVIASCSERKNMASEQITEYYKGFNTSDYNRIKKTIADSLVITEGNYLMNFTPKSFYKQFQWDSVFKPTYKVVQLNNQGKLIIATVSVKSSRLEFLKNNPLTCEHRFHLKSGKITKIENLDCETANWQLWEKQRDSLVKWIKYNHSELDGFIYDLSMKGALDYLNAIELYTNNQVNASD